MDWNGVGQLLKILYTHTPHTCWPDKIRGNMPVKTKKENPLGCSGSEEPSCLVTLLLFSSLFLFFSFPLQELPSSIFPSSFLLLLAETHLRSETGLELIVWLIQETNTIKNWFVAHYWPMWIINQGLMAMPASVSVHGSVCVFGILLHIQICWGPMLLYRNRWPPGLL